MLVSHTGVPLTRSTTFRFTLDPTRAQEQQLRTHAGAARLAYNHHLGRVKANRQPPTTDPEHCIASAKEPMPHSSWRAVPGA